MVFTFFYFGLIGTITVNVVPFSRHIMASLAVSKIVLNFSSESPIWTLSSKDGTLFLNNY